MRKLIIAMLAVLLLCGCGAETKKEETQPAGNTSMQIQLQDQEVTFEPWEQDGLPTEGCYYLTKDVVLTEQLVVSGQLKLHLNNHTIQGEKDITYGSLIHVSAGGDLLIYDAPESNGRIIAPRSITAKPVVTSTVTVAGTATMAGGTVDATEINLEDVANGAGLYVQAGGVLNITGGTVIGGTVICYSLNPMVDVEEEPAQQEGTTQQEGTAQQEEATQEEQPEQQEPVYLELYGKGGSVYVAKGGLCNFSGGTIRNGIAGLGGNVYTEPDEAEPGKFVMTGGLITDGEALFHGGNVYVDGYVEISGGEIRLGKSYCNGGNFFVEGTLEMTGGVIAEGCCDPNGLGGKRGGNLCVNGVEAVVHIANASILDGTATGGEGFGGNISVIGQCAREFSVTDTTISGGKGHRGGNLYFGTLAKDVGPENLDFYMSNVTVSNGVKTYRGANLCMDSDFRGIYVNLIMDNSTFLLDTGETISLGAGSALDTWATLTMNGGSIEGGTLNLYGDSVLTTNGTKLTMEDHGGQGEMIVNP